MKASARKGKTGKAKIRNIGVWNTAFLGDAVLTLPLLQTLHRAFPKAKLDFYVRKGLASLFSAHPALNAVYEYDKRGRDKGLKGLKARGREIRARKYDLWISAHPSLRSAALARLSGAPMRIGYRGRGLAAVYGAIAYTHRVPRRFDDLAEVERLLQLTIPLGLERLVHDPQLVLPSVALAKAEEFWRALPGAPVLGIHPGSVWGTKRWPAEYFASVGVRALEQGAVVLLFAGPGEEAIAALVEKNIRTGQSPAGHPPAGGLLMNLSGLLSLPELAAFIGRLDCYLTNDSGPMHLAWVQGVPVSAIFGPTVEALGFFPRGAASQVHEVSLPCRPCGLHGPKDCPLGHHRCMRDVLPEAVWEDIEDKLFPDKKDCMTD